MRFHAHDKGVVDEVVRHIALNALAGQEKRGDLTEVNVYTFKLNNQDTLLTYRLVPDRSAPTELLLLAVGPHENFNASPNR